RALAAGPLPLPSVPWQTAQYATYISLPDTGDVLFIGTCLMVLSGGLWAWSCAATIPAPRTTAANIKINLLIDITLSPFPARRVSLKPSALRYKKTTLLLYTCGSLLRRDFPVPAIAHQ